MTVSIVVVLQFVNIKNDVMYVLNVVEVEYVYIKYSARYVKHVMVPLYANII